MATRIHYFDPPGTGGVAHFDHSPGRRASAWFDGDGKLTAYSKRLHTGRELRHGAEDKSVAQSRFGHFFKTPV